MGAEIFYGPSLHLSEDAAARRLKDLMIQLILAVYDDQFDEVANTHHKVVKLLDLKPQFKAAYLYGVGQLVQKAMFWNSDLSVTYLNGVVQSIKEECK